VALSGGSTHFASARKTRLNRIVRSIQPKQPLEDKFWCAPHRTRYWGSILNSLITSCPISRNTEQSDLLNRIGLADFSYAEIPSDACAVYHSYVEATPRSSGIWADHPRAWMRETSSNFRGVPSGKEGSKTIRPL